MKTNVEIVCPHCGVRVGDIVGLAAHLRQSEACDTKAHAQIRRENDAALERLRTENPTQYDAIQRLKTIRSTGGSDPLFDYEQGRLKR